MIVSFSSQLEEISLLCPSREPLDLSVGAAVTPSACLHWFFNAAQQLKYLKLVWGDKLNLLNLGAFCDLNTIADKPVITCTDGSPDDIPYFASPLFHLAWGDMEAVQSLLCLATIDSSVALFTSISRLGSSILSCQEICMSCLAETASPRLKACPVILGSAYLIKKIYKHTKPNQKNLRKKHLIWTCCVNLFRWHVVGVMDIIQHRIYDCVIYTSLLPLRGTFSGLAIELATHRLLLLCYLSVANRSRPGWTLSQRANILYVPRGIHPICPSLSFWSSRTHTCTDTCAVCQKSEP